MAEPVAIQKFVDADLDVDTLEAAVNEDKIITARLGREYASVPMASRLLVENGLLGARPFSTYAKMTAPDVDPPLVDGDYAIVTNDGDLAKNGVYEKVGGTWAYIKYNPSSQIISQVNELFKFEPADVVSINPANNIYNPAHNKPTFYVRASSRQISISSTTESTIVTVNPGSTYLINTDAHDDFLAASLSNSDSYMTGLQLVAAKPETIAPGVSRIVVPNGYSFLYLNVVVGSTLNIKTSLIINEYEGAIKNIAGAALSDKNAVKKNDLSFADNPNLFNINGDVVDGYYVTNAGSSPGKIREYAGASIAVIPVNPSTEYVIDALDMRSDVFTASVSSSLGQLLNKTTQKLILADSSDNTKIITTPSDAYYLFVTLKLPSFNFNITDTINVFKRDAISSIDGYQLKDSKARNDLEQVKKLGSKLLNSKWIAVGDSITEHNFRSNKNYHDYIADDIKSLTVINYGISGTGYFDRYNIADTITQTDFDYLTVFWGTNDWGNQKDTNKKPLGTFLDTGTATISGCINTALTGLLNKFYDKKIAVITPLPRLTNWGENSANNAYGYTLKQLVDLINRYCNHYSIPCLDLYHESNLPVWIPAANTKYFTAPAASTPDGLHPNDLGHEVIANKVKTFLESI